MTQTARKELELFFGADRELEAKFKRGDLDRLHWRLEKDHIRNVFSERCPLGEHALQTATVALEHWSLYSKGHRAAKERLVTIDRKAYIEYLESNQSENLERLTFKILEALESVTPIPVPAPTTEAVEKHKVARYRQIGTPSMTVGPGGGGGVSTNSSITLGSGGSGAAPDGYKKLMLTMDTCPRDLKSLRELTNEQLYWMVIRSGHFDRILRSRGLEAAHIAENAFISLSHEGKVHTLITILDEHDRLQKESKKH